ncbi:MAG: hypothetical protein V1744_02380 [Candidatus Altiarchaeota archaeon]
MPLKWDPKYGCKPPSEWSGSVPDSRVTEPILKQRFPEIYSELEGLPMKVLDLQADQGTGGKKLRIILPLTPEVITGLNDRIRCGGLKDEPPQASNVKKYLASLLPPTSDFEVVLKRGKVQAPSSDAKQEILYNELDPVYLGSTRLTSDPQEHETFKQYGIAQYLVVDISPKSWGKQGFEQLFPELGRRLEGAGVDYDVLIRGEYFRREIKKQMGASGLLPELQTKFKISEESETIPQQPATKPTGQRPKSKSGGPAPDAVQKRVIEQETTRHIALKQRPLTPDEIADITNAVLSQPQASESDEDELLRREALGFTAKPAGYKKSGLTPTASDVVEVTIPLDSSNILSLRQLMGHSGGSEEDAPLTQDVESFLKEKMTGYHVNVSVLGSKVSKVKKLKVEVRSTGV